MAPNVGIDSDNREFESSNGRYQFRNRGPSDNFNPGHRRHGGRLNSLRVRVDQEDQSQNVKNPPIRLCAICMSPVELSYVHILLNETFTKTLWDTGAEKLFISEEVYKKYFFYEPVGKSQAEAVRAQGAKCRILGIVELQIRIWEFIKNWQFPILAEVDVQIPIFHN
ncbi:uncharacterized protein TNCV_4297481 [Trichonephila clavipes]|nr:uncharacterized protein TNCV_4297481 [Trichonephila clavipes]